MCSDGKKKSNLEFESKVYLEIEIGDQLLTFSVFLVINFHPLFSFLKKKEREKKSQVVVSRGIQNPTHDEKKKIKK